MCPSPICVVPYVTLRKSILGFKLKRPTDGENIPHFVHTIVRNTLLREDVVSF